MTHGRKSRTDEQRIGDDIAEALRRAYDPVLDEPIPEELLAVVRRLQSSASSDDEPPSDEDPDPAPAKARVPRPPSPD
ncbi:MAG: NepR family anti-sigma factor [Gemmatimonas sp.]